ncbi:hypothetical protein BSKO_00463 [Bryopsis sp. KO-2023]|nr:hypothetical protein BSKO_00463 [Bryopsis sp. KO-2023]
MNTESPGGSQDLLCSETNIIPVEESRCLATDINSIPGCAAPTAQAFYEKRQLWGNDVRRDTRRRRVDTDTCGFPFVPKRRKGSGRFRNSNDRASITSPHTLRKDCEGTIINQCAPPSQSFASSDLTASDSSRADLDASGHQIKHYPGKSLKWSDQSDYRRATAGKEALRDGIRECKRSIKNLDSQISNLQKEKEEAIACLNQAMTVLNAPHDGSRSGGLRSEERLPVEANKHTGGQTKEYMLGMNLGKRKAYDEFGNQVSKSCHQCQEQHIPFVCKSGLTCLNSWYPGLTVRDSEKRCPRCRKLCKCKACLRKSKSLKLLALPPEERKALFNFERDLEVSDSPGEEGEGWGDVGIRDSEAANTSKGKDLVGILTMES